ncbi:head-to-tail connector protein [Mycobacterium phage Journey13]|nr:head-to-tail connector protein [Mycobacterium phage Journey13]
MAKVYAKANKVAARHADTRAKVKDVRDGVTRRAKANLARANKTSRITEEGYFPASITEQDGDTDFHTILNAPNAFALEFGHAPSGAFGPRGVFAGRQKAPTPPEYILTRAAIGGTVS